jgi:hypothetical protein
VIALMSSNGRQPGTSDEWSDSMNFIDSRDPVKLSYKNTFFEIPDVEEAFSAAIGPATCPLPTEGWWSSPSPSRGRSEASPNPLDDIGPTPDWSPTPHPPPGVIAPSIGRFDRMLVEAMDEEDVADVEVMKETPTPAVTREISFSKGGAGGLSTPWEDQSLLAAPITRDASNRLPPPGPPPEKPARMGMFEKLLQQDLDNDSEVEASRRSSLNSGIVMPETPWDGPSGLDTPWEETPQFAALPGFSSFRPPLLSTGPASGYVGGSLPVPSTAVGRSDFQHILGEPARLPPPESSLLEQPLHSMGPLLSVPPPVPTAPVGPPAGKRVTVDLAGALGFGTSMLPASQNSSPEKTKARRRRGSKEAKNPDHDKDDKWWLPTSIYVDLGNLVKVPKESPVPIAIAAA